MTLVSALISACGLSNREAAKYLDVRLDTLHSWSSGRRTPPDGAVHQLAQLYVDVLDAIDRSDPKAEWPTEGTAAVVQAGITARQMVK